MSPVFKIFGIGLAIVGVLVFVASAWVGYTVAHYKYGYEEKVKRTICEMVHEAAIKGMECDGR